MRCLVTGGAGFIGSNLVEALIALGDEVVVLDNLTTGSLKNLNFGSSEDRLEVVESDVRDAETVRRCVEGAEVVFHLAAEVGNLNSLEHPIRDAEVNVLGTINVLRAAETAGVRRLVYSSSSAIFGEPRYLPVDEEHPTLPESYYGVSKLAAECYCLAAAQIMDVGIVCLRYFNVYGPRQAYSEYANVIPIFAGRLRRGEPLIVYGDGEQTRDFVYVHDVLRASLLAAESDLTGVAFNIGTGEATTVNRLAEILQELMETQVEVQHVAPRPGEVRHSVAEIARARNRLGYEPQWSLKQGLREFMRGYG